MISFEYFQTGMDTCNLDIKSWNMNGIVGHRIFNLGSIWNWTRMDQRGMLNINDFYEFQIF
ncbi:hypothetical protein DERP_015281 [Dermatophagoides pteronyssinus]|uniref:BspA family leucine-rich repeat surface protein n=1 Tax=Dermatophagoides pteronyssinus TaxID=6956 RepID=A0ABQ8J3V1_DERPT|nr:hypothetical protein DERP_015280 [Dermatophagoides pteronyssinus]KAH9417162.1 hypothetical protein DERP_015281 [Dermatophagoides pteronyssinus]